MPSRQNRAILIVLILIAGASLWRTILVERDKQRIKGSYKEAQQLVSQLEAERTQLSGELSNAQRTIEVKAGDIKGLQTELQHVQDKLDQTVVELSSLQREHEQLRQHDASLTTQFSSVLAEKQELETKLASIKELKLAIREVKRKMRNERWQTWLARIETLKEEDQRKLASGNRGYIVREGQPTLGSARQLQVHVLEPQSAQ